MSDTQTTAIEAYIGIGSNLDGPVDQVLRAVDTLATIDGVSVTAVSSLYRNPPMGPVDQPDYVNAVAGLSTMLTPRALLARLQALEQAQGRVRDKRHRWGPRVLDLDILTYDDRTIVEPGLHIPHPGISERNFVLFPLFEIAPMISIPGLGLISELVRDRDSSTLEKIAEADPNGVE